MSCSVADSPCPRCAELGEQIAQLESRLRFAPCGFGGPGSARVTVTMPDGRVSEGWMCRAHQVLLSASGRFGLNLVAGDGGREGPCAWRVPAEEAAMDEQVPVPEEVTG